MLSPEDTRIYTIKLGRIAMRLMGRERYISVITNEENGLLAINRALCLLKEMKEEERTKDNKQWTLP